MGFFFRKKRENLERAMAKSLYEELQQDEELTRKIREAETEQEMMAILHEAGFSTDSGVIIELIKIFAKELTDEDLVNVTGG